jgi:hypothetical protein
LLLLPVGTTYHGTGKQHSVGKVQGVRYLMLAQKGESRNGLGLLAQAAARLTTAVETAWLAAG